MARIALVTCDRFPQLHEDDRPLLAALGGLGHDPGAAVWDDPAVAWDRFDLAVLRSPWDYVDRVDEFIAWARSVPRLANPADVLAWNVDKHYLAGVAAAGVPVIPTTFVDPGEPVPDVPPGDVVVKPTVSAGARDTLRLDDPAAITAQIHHIHRSGRTAMVQPYLDAVDDAGETAVIFLGGEHSHAARKGPLLPRGESRVEGLYAIETMTARQASAAELDVAVAALATVPDGGDRLLYARVDLIPDADGTPTVIEIEVTEPSLFLDLGDAVDRFARAIDEAVNRAAR